MKQLQDAGWRVITVWECQLKRGQCEALRAVLELLADPGNPSGLPARRRSER